jgi:hypothetical protein
VNWKLDNFQSGSGLFGEEKNLHFGEEWKLHDILYPAFRVILLVTGNVKGEWEGEGRGFIRQERYTKSKLQTRASFTEVRPEYTHILFATLIFPK